MLEPVIWKAPRLGWHVRVREHREDRLVPTVWGLSYGGGVTSPWWRLTRAGAVRKAARVIRSIERDNRARAAERAALHNH
jgi:hypothetical protein